MRSTSSALNRKPTRTFGAADFGRPRRIGVAASFA
jgi:hypothetical protein